MRRSGARTWIRKVARALGLSWREVPSRKGWDINRLETWVRDLAIQFWPRVETVRMGSSIAVVFHHEPNGRRTYVWTADRLRTLPRRYIQEQLWFEAKCAAYMERMHGR